MDNNRVGRIISVVMAFLLIISIFLIATQSNKITDLCLERNKLALNFNYLQSKIPYNEYNLKQAQADLGNQSIIYTSQSMKKCK